MRGDRRPSWAERTSRALAALRGGTTGRAVLFTAVGGATTAVNALLYLLLRGTFATGPANVLALLVTTIGSSALHRRFVFTGLPERRLRMHLQTAATFLFYCVSSSAALALLRLVDADAGSVAEAVAVAVMSVAGGITRFTALRLWVFHRDRRRPAGERPIPAAA
ncbi:GtrA family protein [Saccharopolyspora gregorii]|uniref:GtrA/DPMS transmembrane domain-containing protein n=1 Tax=Saccharopolyspora gregorii TaxID=33914 RepID=A0ABP6RUX7_9PSEU|nr:GtrA family protein [Saccharopolyspora gregorii]